MTVWWLRGYIDGVHDLHYSAFVNYGEAVATRVREQVYYPTHTFKITKGEV